MNGESTIALPIEVKFEPYEFKFYDDKIHVGHKLISVKHAEIELLDPYSNDDFNAISVSFEQFENGLRNQLSVPKNMLRLSMNVEESGIKTVSIPWTMKLSRQRKNVS